MQIIAPDDSPVLDVLSRMAPQSSKTTLRSWLKEGRVSIDGQIAKTSNTPVKQGQIVALNSKPQLVAHKLRLIYEDNDLVAIEKPEGMLSVATAFEKGETAHALLKEKYHPRKVYVVHRLDQDTSGVMLFALSEQGYNSLKDIFEKHDIDRKYCAIVEGRVSPEQGSWQSYLYEDVNYVVHSTSDPEKGRLATTHYRVLDSSRHYSRIELTLETGRKNQIRVQCADAGHPVIGDKKYGSSVDPIKRLCLHAFLLALKHPVTGKPLRFTSPVPEIFNRLLKTKANDA